MCDNLKSENATETINKAEIKACLDTRQMGQYLNIFSTIDSTNTAALMASKDKVPNGSVFIAEYQSQGDGRIGRKWISEKNKNILMSILIYPEMNYRDIPKLTLIIGLSVCKVLINELGIEARVKWPNDIVVGNKKVCGVLTKSLVVNAEVISTTIGIGLNVNSCSFPDEIINKATSLYLETKQSFNRSKIIGLILTQFEKDYLEFLTDLEIPEEYRDLCCSLNRDIEFYVKNEKHKGKATDINADGELVIKSEDGVYIANSGEVLVQGIYS